MPSFSSLALVPLGRGVVSTRSNSPDVRGFQMSVRFETFVVAPIAKDANPEVALYRGCADV